MFFKHFDYLASLYGFSFDDSMRYQTNCGGFLSVILSLLAIVTIAQMGSTFLDRSNPVTASDSNKYYSPPPVNFDSRFNVAFRMSVGADHLYKNLDMIKIKLFEVTIYKSNFSNLTAKEVPMTICEENHFPYQKKYFDDFRLNQSLCPVMDGRTIKGAFLSEYFTYFQARFYLCINDPITGKSKDGDGIVCKNATEIYNFLKSNIVRAHIFYADSDFNNNDYSNPNITYMNNYNVDITYSTLKENHMYFQYYNLTSDDTYFFLAPSSRFFSSVAFNFFAERPAFRETFVNNLVLINIRADKTINSVRRSYSLFSQTIASVGAILNLAMLFFKLIIFSISRIQFFTRLIQNSIYLFYKNPNYMIKLSSDNIDKEKKKKLNFGKNLEDSNMNIINENVNLQEGKLVTTKHVEMLNINIKSDLTFKQDVKKIGNNQISVDNINESAKKLENFNLVKYNHDHNFYELCLISLCPCISICNKKLGRDMTMIDYSKKHYYKYTDFFKFLDKFIELNVLKKLLLKKDEVEIVDILKRIVLIKKFDILEIVKPVQTKQDYNSTTVTNLNDKLKKKGSLCALEEKLKNYINNALTKENKSTIEMNIIEQFDDILKG